MDPSTVQQSPLDSLDILTGEQGYRSAIACNGIGGKAHGVFYFEVEVLPPKTPLPYLNIKPAVRVGVCQMDIQHVEKPLGSNRLSYSYSSSGKLANSSKSVAQNEDYCKFNDQLRIYLFIIYRELRIWTLANGHFDCLFLL